ncbi:serpentine type 7TM GPCR chemoreceptor srd domain-containing protein [Ditylenchus destructor]|uniref:Serpentine type 7TM GPCR chemoreceptor srd domain-containing protein n=1 Tax=Ditylenchus destructor TaxID=166010 RepID=A0AAD4QVU1_9BILA|nr:serpentine type 7TM GPCR chemoreceptor srd domain-containing protein [Ditylenchus destructor]
MILNALLIVLIFKNESLSDKGYKPIILQICITDMLNLIIFAFYMPAYTRLGNDTIFYTLGFFNDLFENAPLFTQIIHRIWFFFLFLFLFSPSVQFLYRYLILCRDWKPSYRLYMGLCSPVYLFLLSFSILHNSGTVFVSRTFNAVYRDYIFSDNPANVDLLFLGDFSSAVSQNAFKIVFAGLDEELTEFRETNKTSGEKLELKKGLPTEYQSRKKYLNERSYTLERFSI